MEGRKTQVEVGKMAGKRRQCDGGDERKQGHCWVE